MCLRGQNNLFCNKKSEAHPVGCASFRLIQMCMRAGGGIKSSMGTEEVEVEVEVEWGGGGAGLNAGGPPQ